MAEPKTINDILQANPEPAVPMPRDRPHDLGKLKAGQPSKEGSASQTNSSPKEDAAGCAKEFPKNKRGEHHPVCGSP